MRRLLGFVLIVMIAAACAAAQVPQSNHVVWIVEENHSYSSVIGNTTMPYFNSLAQQYGLATQFYGNTHPSIGDYFMMTTGQIYTNDDSFTATINIDNLVRHILTAGKTWKSYAQGLPYAGYTGGNTGYYLKRHNPFAYFSDVANSSVQKLNLVPLTQLQTDLTNQQLPNLTYIVPDVMNDMHNGTTTQADSFLSTWVPKILADPGFQKDGILIITWDESFDNDTANGGGHTPTVVMGPGVKQGYKSSTFYQLQSVLKTTMLALGMTSGFPAASATAPDMSEFFGSSTSPAPAPAPAPAPTTTGVTITSPTNGATVSSPVTVTANAAANSGRYITTMRVYVDYTSAYTVNASSLTYSPALASGAHNITVNAWDNTGAVYKSAVNITVGSAPAPSPTPAPTTTGVTISSPTPGATLASPVHITATAAATSGRYITAMRIYLDYTSAYTVNAAKIDTYLNVAKGAHNITINAWDNTGAVYKSAENINVQ